MPSRLPIEIAFDHYQADRHAEAEVAARQILAGEPDYFHALHLMGLLALERGAPNEAVAFIGRAVEKEQRVAPAFLHLGLAHSARGDLEAACTSFQRAAALDPGDLGVHKHLAVMLSQLGRIDEAIAEFKVILALAPDLAEAHQKLGSLYQIAGDIDAAIACHRKALAIDPVLADAHFALGLACAAAGDDDSALARFHDALRCKPGLADAHFEIGSLLWTRGAQDDALACFGATISLRPDYVEARWARAMSQLTPVRAEDEDHQARRSAFATALDELDAWFDASHVADGYKAVGNATPFLLAYYEQNNHDLLSRYGNLCVRLMKHWQDAQGLAPAARARTATIRVGIVSAHVHDHSVWNAIVRGWCQHLDPARFSLHIFDLGRRNDAETAYARARRVFPAGSGRPPAMGRGYSRPAPGGADLSGNRHGCAHDQACEPAPRTGADRRMGASRDHGTADARPLSFGGRPRARGRATRLSRAPGIAATPRMRVPAAARERGGHRFRKPVGRSRCAAPAVPGNALQIRPQA